MREAAVVVGMDGSAMYWHLPEDRTSGSLPDAPSYPPSVRLWSFLVENMGRVRGIAHSHPGGGVPSPSSTDVETFTLVEKSLGRLDWWIASSESLVLVRWSDGEGRYVKETILDEPDWVRELRVVSEYEEFTVRKIKGFNCKPEEVKP